MHTGVSPQAWAKAGARAIATAFDVLVELAQPQQQPGQSAEDTRQMSG